MLMVNVYAYRLLSDGGFYFQRITYGLICIANIQVWIGKARCTRDDTYLKHDLMRIYGN